MSLNNLSLQLVIEWQFASKTISHRGAKTKLLSLSTPLTLTCHSFSETIATFIFSFLSMICFLLKLTVAISSLLIPKSISLSPRPKIGHVFLKQKLNSIFNDDEAFHHLYMQWWHEWGSWNWAAKEVAEGGAMGWYDNCEQR